MVVLAAAQMLGRSGGRRLHALAGNRLFQFVEDVVAHGQFVEGKAEASRSRFRPRSGDSGSALRRDFQAPASNGKRRRRRPCSLVSTNAAAMDVGALRRAFIVAEPDRARHRRLTDRVDSRISAQCSAVLVGGGAGWRRAGWRAGEPWPALKSSPRRRSARDVGAVRRFEPAFQRR